VVLVVFKLSSYDTDGVIRNLQTVDLGVLDTRSTSDGFLVMVVSEMAIRWDGTSKIDPKKDLGALRCSVNLCEITYYSIFICSTPSSNLS